MIKATELRLGNLLQADKEHYNQFHGHGHVTSIYNKESEDDRFTVDYHYPGKWFEPIPLTPEWLKKMNFLLVDKVWWEIPKMSNWQILDNSSFDNSFCLADDHTILSVKPLKYVHQLQNLYHALTSEELIIKETV